MPRQQERPYESPDWTIRASFFDFHLSSTNPFVARHVLHPRPTRTQVGIHDGLEVTFVLAGSLELQFEEDAFVYKSGGVAFIAMWEPHRWRTLEPDTEQISVVFLPDFIGEAVLRDGEWLSTFTCSPSRRPTVTTQRMREAVLAVGREMQGEIQRKRRGWQTAVQLGLTRLLFALTRNRKAPTPSDQLSGPRSPGLARIMPALAAVHARPARRVPLTDAAAACGLSPAQFSRVFRQFMGLSFARFRLRAHLAYAARLLLTTDTPVDAIAARAGFVDGSHLHRHFTRHYGTTPGQYRDQGG